MHKTLFALFAAALAAGPALAQPAPPAGAPPLTVDGDAPAEPPSISEDDAGRLVSHARKLRESKGCAAAAAAYRVVAGMGEGQEAAQHELGECLMEIDGATPAETALFRQEGQFWLTRAAYAGNARAQRRLVVELSAPASALHNPVAALQWALVYQANPTSDLYGYKTLPPTLIPGLKGALTPAEIAAAEAAATGFAPLYLQKFEAPKRAKSKGDRKPPGAPPRRPGGWGRIEKSRPVSGAAFPRCFLPETPRRLFRRLELRRFGRLAHRRRRGLAA